MTREGVADAVALLRSSGYRAVFGRHAFESDGYLAGDDAARAEDLAWAFSDPEIDAVWATRGGYGTARLLDLLDLDRIAASQRLFAGFSDLTSLHLALGRRGVRTLHAPMALTFSVPRPPWVAASFLDALSGGDGMRDEAPSARCVVPGVAEGDVVGGCLCLLCDSIGTPNALDASGRVLLIEDVDEPPHRVDAMLTHLAAIGVLQSAAGIVVGEMTRTEQRADPSIGERPWDSIVRERLEALSIPSVVGFPFGHAPAMLSLWLGARARLDASAGRLTYV